MLLRKRDSEYARELRCVAIKLLQEYFCAYVKLQSVNLQTRLICCKMSKLTLWHFKCPVYSLEVLQFKWLPLFCMF